MEERRRSRETRPFGNDRHEGQVVAACRADESGNRMSCFVHGNAPHLLWAEARRAVRTAGATYDLGDEVLLLDLAAGPPCASRRAADEEFGIGARQAEAQLGEWAQLHFSAGPVDLGALSDLIGGPEPVSIESPDRLRARFTGGRLWWPFDAGLLRQAARRSYGRRASRPDSSAWRYDVKDHLGGQPR